MKNNKNIKLIKKKFRIKKLLDLLNLKYNITPTVNNYY